MMTMVAPFSIWGCLSRLGAFEWESLYGDMAHCYQEQFEMTGCQVERVRGGWTSLTGNKETQLSYFTHQGYEMSAHSGF